MGLLLCGAAGAWGTFLGFAVTDNDALILLFGLGGLALFVAAAVLISVGHVAPRDQRDEARERLGDIATAAHDFDVEGTRAIRSTQGRWNDVVELEILNIGRAGLFSATLLGFEGTVEQLRGYSPVEWAGSPNEILEYIPSRERRTLSLGIIQDSENESLLLAFQPLTSRGEKYFRRFDADTAPGRVVLLCQVAARAEDGIGYSRTFSVSVTRKASEGKGFVGLSYETFVALEPSRDGDVRVAPSFAHLLDYEVRQ